MTDTDTTGLWDQWNAGGGPRYPHTKVVQFLFRRFPQRAARGGVAVLDFGCGSGVHTVFLANEGFSAHGVDISAVGVTNTRAWLDTAAGTATLAVASVERTPFADASFDALICVGVLECLGPEAFGAAIGEAVRLLKPGAPAMLLFATDEDFRITEQKVPGLRGVTQSEVEAALAPHHSHLAQVWIDRYTTTYQNRRIRQDEHLVTLIKGGP